jgi:hypothetical protein
MPVSRHRTNHYINPPTEQTVPWRLQERILAQSFADSWDAAKREWDLLRVCFADGPVWCACGHPISECCLIVNRLNGNQVVVGNVCVEQFIGLPSERLFAALRRIIADIGAALNAEAIEHAYREGWLTSWEATFYRDTKGRCKLSTRQRAIRVQINQKVLARCLRGEVCNAR